MTRKFEKLQPNDIQIDPRFQRSLDLRRAKSIAKKIDLHRIGVPVVSRRSDGTVAIDGQHRIIALQLANLGDEKILCEVYEGLSLEQEAELFLQLNGGRKAVRVYDKWKAELVAKRPETLEINELVTNLGLRVVPGGGGISAVNSLRFVHGKYKNLREVLLLLRDWAGEDVQARELTWAYHGDLLRSFGAFLFHYPNVDRRHLLKKLRLLTPERLYTKIRREVDPLNPLSSAGTEILRHIYNHGRRDKLPPPGSASDQAAE